MNKRVKLPQKKYKLQIHMKEVMQLVCTFRLGQLIQTMESTKFSNWFLAQ
jgi:hypothetical protein